VITSVNKELSRDERDRFKQDFAEHGYFVVPDIVSQVRLDQLQVELSEAFSAATKSGALFSGGGLTSGHLNCFPGLGARFVYDQLLERGVIDFMKELNPNMLRMPNVGCNFNLPGSHAQHYHTDHPFPREFMIANITVIDTVIENGAIEMVPGSHKRPYKYSQFVIERPHRNSKRLPTKRGDVLVRSSNVWHRGMPNRTSMPRPMVAFTWEDGGSKLADPFAADGGDIRFLPNWFKPTRAGRLREKLFVKVPIAYSAMRFARSIYDKGY
jgi:Phytanoyl-CoA dioxygenase (PhyH)